VDSGYHISFVHSADVSGHKELESSLQGVTILRHFDRKLLKEAASFGKSYIEMRDHNVRYNFMF
jgi:hypothetical protein